MTTTSNANQKYAAIAGGILLVFILVIWFSKTGILPSAITPAGSGSTETKVGCDRFTGDEKSACNNNLDNSNALTKSIVSAAEKLDPKLCDTVSE